MKIGIYFASKHGQTRKIAAFLAVQLHSLNKSPKKGECRRSWWGPCIRAGTVEALCKDNRNPDFVRMMTATLVPCGNF